MIADDEAIISRHLEQILSEMGYHVVGKATNGVEAIEKAKELKPDIVIMDIKMPGEIDGITAAGRIKTETETPSVFLTAYTEDHLIERAKKVNPLGYIVKPFQDRQVKAVIECALYTKALEQQLKESEKLYRTLVETSPDAIILTDLEGRIIKANAQTAVMLGYKNVDDVTLERETLSDIVGDEITTKVVEGFRKVEENEVLTSFECDVTRRDGSLLPIEASVSLVDDDEGVPKGCIGVLRDISARKKAELEAKIQQEQLIQADKMVSLGTIVSGVAHEINNPNNFIMLNTSVLQKVWKELFAIVDDHYKTKGDFSIGNFKYSYAREKIMESLDHILEGARRIRRIVDELANFSRKNINESLEEMDVNAAVNSSVKLMDNLIRNTTDIFTLKLGDVPAIACNFQHLEQIIVNLIQNACQAIPERNRSLTVSTSHNRYEKSIEISVTDEGVGIAPEYVNRVLDPFFTTRRSSGGTGLGLSVSNRIIKDYGGRLEIESVLGKGTTAKIVLPLKGSEKKAVLFGGKNKK